MCERLRMARLLFPCLLAAVMPNVGSNHLDDIIGLQDLTRNIWSVSGSADSAGSAMDALDALLVVLNSKKLHKRQSPSTCPYCPFGYPCSQGCPTAPNPSCGQQNCPPGPSGMPGLPGSPGLPGFPVYGPDNPVNFPGPPGPPGGCFPGKQGSPGMPGQDGTCPVTQTLPNIDMHAVRQHMSQYMCPPLGKCRYNIDDLVLRLNRVVAQLDSLNSYKNQLTALGRTLAVYRSRYIDSKRPGPPGHPGAQGLPGMKGFPGYEGPQGQCKFRGGGNNLPGGMPGVAGPKGEPGPSGDKICDCRGDYGADGVIGPSLMGHTGSKGYKGAKGIIGSGGHRGR